MDDEQFVAQLAQFSALEINTEESDKLDSLLTFASMNQGINLIGKSVEVDASQSGATGTTSAAGTVTAVSFASGQPLLTVKTSASTLTDVPLTNVSLIQSSSGQ
jgi:flagellar basal-body rod modification protein FlgD